MTYSSSSTFFTRTFLFLSYLTMPRILNNQIYISQTLHYTEAVARKCSIKKVFLEILQNSQENTSARVSFLIKLQAESCNFIKKETLVQVFSYEFYKKIVRNTRENAKIAKKANPTFYFIFIHEDLHILHLHIDSLLCKISNVPFIAKEANVLIIGISDLIRLCCSKRARGVSSYVCNIYVHIKKKHY